MKEMIRKDEEIEITDINAGAPDLPEEEVDSTEGVEEVPEDSEAIEEVSFEAKDDAKDAELVKESEEEVVEDSVETEEVPEDSEAIEEVSVEAEDDAKDAESAEESKEEVVETPSEPEEVKVETADDEDDEPKIDVNRANWYAIRTFSGQERKIMDSLLSIISREGFADRIFEVIVPTQNVIEMRDGKKRSRTKVYFPGYVLVQMHHDKETQYLVENTYGVLNFIGPGNKPQSLQKREIKRILGEVDEQSKAKSIEAPFKVDDAVKVVDGPFNDFRGFVQEVNDEKQKVKVMVSIFGRATPVELDFLQVEIEK